MTDFKDISIEFFDENLKDDSKIIDIRDQDSYSSGNIPNSINYNSTDLIELSESTDKQENIVVVCYHGNSSRKVAAYLTECGFQNIYSLIGGYTEWKEKYS